jgi:alkanesulfonate monooxygenase SsuD/methylene tetrahydromethanopterin reductase-like flavin-dependent oxidoreductase (luciferase family)
VDIDICLDPRLSSAETARLGLLAEDQGIRAVWNTSDLDARDPFTNLAELACRTSTLKLGSMALSPYEIHPFRLATSLLTLNELGGGRAEIALGAGANVLEPAGLTADRPVAHLRECLELVKGATTQRPFTYEGELYRLTGFDPRWVTAPAPEVHACAMGPQMLRMASGVADGVLYSDYTPSLARQSVDRTRAQVAANGRDPAAFAINSFQALYLADDMETARRRATSEIADRALFRENITSEFLSRDEFRLLLDNMDDLDAMAASGGAQTSVPGVPDRVLAACVDELTLVGTFDDPAPVIARLLAFRGAGMDRLALGIGHEAERTLRVLGERVLGALRA